MYDNFNSLLGTNFARSRTINLEAIGLPSLDLSGLEVVFSEDEVRAVVMDLPEEKAPGPDGFTGLFYKLAWHIIKADVMNALLAFWALDSRSLQHLNGAYMVLLQKKSLPLRVEDYRPISLIHSFSKLLTKCLANRLAVVLDGLVDRNQSAFIKGRCIQDNFRAVRLSCKTLHKRHIPSFLLKLDIAKAFDSVCWAFLLEILHLMGFGSRWRDWMAVILSTASTKVLLNGVPGRRICHARRLRQGDPLSPMLFVLVMEAFNRTFQWLQGEDLLLQLGQGSPIQRVSLYANDMVVFLAPSENDLHNVKLALQVLGEASGLFANLDKSVAIPICCSDDDVAMIQLVLSYRVEFFPSRYLGIPLSIFKLSRNEEQPLVDAIAARLSAWKGRMMNAVGRATLVKATLSAVPVHMATALCLSPWAIGRIDKLRRSFLWSGAAEVAGGRCKVAWEVLTRPTELGGLGVVDLCRMGVALRLRWPWLRRAEPARPWHGLRDSEERAVTAFFEAATASAVGNGESTLFWTDSWLQGSNIRHLAPTVFQAVPKRRRGCTVAEALLHGAWVHHVAGPHSPRLIAEFVLLSNLLEQVQLIQGTPDMFSWRLSADGRYSAASAYGAMFLGCSRPAGARVLWKTSAPPRVKFFFWLLMYGKCWTAHRRWRHGLQDACSCVFCDQADETMDHLVLGCVFSREVWERCLAAYHLHGLIRVQERNVMMWWLESRRPLPKEIRRAFDSLLFLVGWTLWKERNSRTFGGASRTADQVLAAILEEAGLWTATGFRWLSVLEARRTGG